MPDKIKLGKLLCGLENKAIVASFPFFGGSNSGGMLGKLLNYGANFSSSSIALIPYKLMLSIIIEIPPKYIFHHHEYTEDTEFFEYHALKIKSIKLSELADTITTLYENAITSLRMDISLKTIVNALIIRDNNETIYLKVHFNKNFYKMRFFCLNGFKQNIQLKKYIEVLNPNYYYYSPTVLIGKWSKLSIIGTLKPVDKNFAMGAYVQYLNAIIPVYKF